ncbi:MAG: hypothetical protein Kow0025_24340 [Thermodesulfovibrionales bacterium]
MDEMAKLKHLIGHWVEHNVEHAATYNEWAARAEAGGNARASEILRKIASETEKLNRLFEEARAAL